MNIDAQWTTDDELGDVAVVASTCRGIVEPQISYNEGMDAPTLPLPARLPVSAPVATSVAASDSESPKLIGGRYRLLRKLGSGAMGSVWAAEHMTLGSPAAIKLINPELVDDEEVVRRFFREARTASMVRNPHVVQVLDCGFDGSTPYIALELLRGESLAQRLTRRRTFSIGYTAWVVDQLASALAPAHVVGIVHRDIKLENVFIAREGVRNVLKVLDFGIAKLTGPSRASDQCQLTKPGFTLGSPTSMSPEQARASADIDHRSDIWALGTLAFECLLGEPAFQGKSLPQMLMAIASDPLPVPSKRGASPKGFDEWFAKACARNRNDRFQSVREAAEDLRRVADRSEVTPQMEPPPAPRVEASTTLPETLPSARRVSGWKIALPRTRTAAVAGAVILGVASVVAAWCVTPCQVDSVFSSSGGLESATVAQLPALR